MARPVMTSLTAAAATTPTRSTASATWWSKDSTKASTRVLASVGYVLPDYVEVLTLVGLGDISAIGNAANNILGGNDGRNTLAGGFGDDELFGNAGDDILDGGAGSDRLEGGTGNDSYVIDSLGDRLFEAAGEGVDLVESSVSLTL
jgi:Ca2+-binding RTX toxin-like protein